MYEAIGAAGFSAQDSTSWRIELLNVLTRDDDICLFLPPGSSSKGQPSLRVPEVSYTAAAAVTTGKGLYSGGRQYIFSIHFSSFIVRTKKTQMPKVEKIVL